MKIINKTKNSVIADHARVADSFFSRMVGLLNRGSLPSGEALVIPHCQSIHMFFMRFAIDVIFVDKDHSVVGLVSGIRPYRLSPVFFKASYAIEGNVGMIDRSQTALQDIIQTSQDI